MTWGEVRKNARYLQFEVRDPVEHEDAATNHGIDGDEFLERLGALVRHQVAARTDIIEVFWLRPP